MLYLARFRNELAPIIVDAASADDAVALVTAEVEEAPAALHEVPPGVLLLEVKFADPIGEEDDENPANLTESQIACEPLGEFPGWLAGVDDEPIPDELGTAPTEEPPPVEEGSATDAD